MLTYVHNYKSYGSKMTHVLCMFSILMGVLFTSGLFVTLFFPVMYHNEIAKQMTLIEGTPAFAEWMQPSVPIFTKIYLFSLQNPNQTLDKTEKPRLKQLGPFTFREVETKDQVVFNHKNRTISYKVRKSWFFEPEMSDGSLDDIVTTINVPVLGSAEASKGQFFMQWGLSSTFDNIGSQVFIQKTVRELLFECYEDTLLALADWFGQESTIPLDRFGWFYKRNGTSWADGTYNMYTGQDDISQMGKINTWNYENRTHFNDECGQVHGSAGGFYPPGTAQPNLLLFSHDACRTLSFNFKGKSKVENVPGLLYKLDETTFANESTYAPNYCFNNNLPTGVQNSTQCKQDSPAYISFPHFYQADPYYQNQFQDGSIQPEGDLHESRIVLEPVTGIPMEVLIRLQINVKLNPMEGISLLRNVPKDLYFPVIWFEAHGIATPSVAQTINLLVQIPHYANLVGAILVVIGLVGVIVCVALRCRRFRSKSGKISESKSNDDFDLSIEDFDSHRHKIIPIIKPHVSSGLNVNQQLVHSNTEETLFLNSSESEAYSSDGSKKTSFSSVDSARATLVCDLDSQSRLLS
ncbi:protein croquemort-like isoform X1 [Tigriopus californicus]|uniref:protein croquemort-like isoform X1 n=1 Tax=Tigriopus californicus TaxID=6832 RepID=UPI0027DA6066|nr:protein croquemort-like isoform X1 [Tigriopus californicus]|eukprot:TCALIF_09784-PA protein Name:"Similar to crq Protein croquemort (Drosophila melanogaster)" AED:0.08 eAED:0.08 QI:115/1/0.75/1/0.85/0.87/8/0/577